MPPNKRKAILEKVICLQCGKENLFSIRLKKKFCNANCRYAYMKGKTFEELHGEETAKLIKEKLSVSSSGTNNANYGKRWNDEQRKRSSLYMIELYKNDEKYRYLSGSANRGKKFTGEYYEKIKKSNQNKWLGKKHSEESKLKIGARSSAKFTDEFKKKMYETMVSNGHWRNKEDLGEFEIYRRKCQWLKLMYDYIVDEQQLSLLKDVGIFSPFTNPKGLVRDHMLSIVEGFNMGVPEIIMRHPCNCQLLTNGQNSSKRSKSHITLEELLDKIKKYSGREWTEHKECLELINRELHYGKD